LHALKTQCTVKPLFKKGERQLPKVYVVTETGQHNITGALDYGQIEIVLPGNVQVAFSPAPTVSRVQRRLENFTDDDYLLFIGDPTAISIVSAVAASRNNGRYKCLKWDRFERRYIPIQIDLRQAKKGEMHDYP
jgi:hypothetical protein